MSSVDAWLTSMSPDFSVENQLIVGVRRTFTWLPGRIVVPTFSAVPTSLNCTPVAT